jgi:radical SAM protein with 4Fe4S-binding SPASM domain
MKLAGLEKIPDLLKLYSSWRKGKGYKPRLLRLLVTCKCNSRCVMCNIWKLAKEKPEVIEDELSTQEWIGLLKELSNMGTESVFISGGETLLRQDITEIIRCAKEKNMHVEMVTNGVLLTETKAEELVRSGLDIINFSIDGHTPEIHEEFRGIRGSLELTKRGIGLIHNAKEKLKSKTPSISISNTLSRINYQFINEMISLKSELGYDTLQFNPVIGKTPGAKELFLADEHLRDLEIQLTSLKTEFQNAGLPVSPLSRPYAICKDKEGAKEGRYADLINKKILCFAPMKETTIDPFGNVYPCSFACPFQNLSEDLVHGHWGADDFCMGNIRNNSFTDIWNGDKYNQMRRKFRDFSALPTCAWCLCRSPNDAILTGLFKDRSLLFNIIRSRIRRIFNKSKGFEWDFLYE